MAAFSRLGGRALVLGAGIAGLLTARVLAEHFEEVVVLERDGLPDSPVVRAGAPQGRHVHFLLLRGKAIIEERFPGIIAELVAAGAVPLDWTWDTRIYSGPGWFLRMPSNYGMLGCSRALLEWTIRQRLAAWENVRFAPLMEARGLITDAENCRVRGVRVRRRLPDSHTLGDEEEWTADLVVDATGRGSQTPQWLAALGYARPQEVVISSFAGYASRVYQPPADWQADWKLLAVLNAYPRVKRGGVVFPIEGGRWISTLVGVDKDYPPTDEDGFLAYARTLLVPDLAEALTRATPLSGITGYQRMENRWRHYERLERWPEGFIVIGDASCTLNPIFGQGMTLAAVCADALGALLARQTPGALTGLGRRAQQAFAKASATPWALASGEDLRLPTAVGPRPNPLTRALYWYSDAFRELLTHDADALRAFVEVAHLLTPPTALFQPRLVARTLRNRFGQGWRKRQPLPYTTTDAPEAIRMTTTEAARATPWSGALPGWVAPFGLGIILGAILGGILGISIARSNRATRRL